ncbi:MAG: GNAT family N-acetyltransferase [Sedimentisphaerales bacterium]|nr:GNAT family N-acetyltransferase [Sedimentisphaerales bacterium]
MSPLGVAVEVLPFKMKYIPAIMSWVKTEADMVQWAGHAFVWPMTQRQFHEHLRESKARLPSLYPFALWNRGRVFAYCELANHQRNSSSAMLSRVIVAPRRRDKGYATFMIREVLRFGFGDLGLNRIWLGVFDFNKAAIACYQRVGFVFEGTLRQSAKLGGSYWNCHVMSILRNEWMNGHGVTTAQQQSG